MRLKQIKWRKNGMWHDAKLGMFLIAVSETVWEISVRDTNAQMALDYCRSVEDGKRKAQAWMEKQINKIVEG